MVVYQTRQIGKKRSLVLNRVYINTKIIFLVINRVRVNTCFMDKMEMFTLPTFDLTGVI